MPGVGGIEDSFEQFHRSCLGTEGPVVLFLLDCDGAVTAVVSSCGFVEPNCSGLLAGGAITVAINNTLH